LEKKLYVYTLLQRWLLLTEKPDSIKSNKKENVNGSRLNLEYDLAPGPSFTVKTNSKIFPVFWRSITPVQQQPD